MFHTFHKASDKPTKVLRRRVPPSCQACQQKKVWISLDWLSWGQKKFDSFMNYLLTILQVACSRQRPQCKECTVTKTTCFYTSSSSRHAFKLQCPSPKSSRAHKNTTSYESGSGSLSPGSSADSSEWANAIPSSGMATPTTDIFDAPMASLMEDNFFYSADMKLQSEDALWPNITAADGFSPKTLEMLPPSPENVPIQGYLINLSAEEISMPNFETDCHHGGTIDGILCDVMGPEWPVTTSSGPACSTSALSVLRQAVNELHILSKCVVCMSSCKSMALLLVITKAVLEHVTLLVDRMSSFDELCPVSMQLDTYSADSDEECFFVYTQIARRHISRFAAVADSFAEAAQRAGWPAHVLSLKDIADEARTLSRSDNGSI